MRSHRHVTLAAVVMFVGAGTLAHAELDAAASGLWRSFLLRYRELSLTQLGDAELDALAREHLIGRLGARYRSWKKEDYADLGALIAAIREKEPERDSFQLVELALAAMLPAIDRYGGYETAADMARFQEAVRQGPGGSVQMTIEHDKAGRLLCFPLAEGPADRAAVLPGAELLAVDGIAVERKELVAVKFAFIGPPASVVRVKVRQPHGKTEELMITRDREPASVVASDGPLGLNIRIRKFDRGSAKLLRELLREHAAKANRLTLDLRGNPGGLRDEAVLAVSLFLPEGTPIGTFVSRGGKESLKDGNGVEVSPESIRIVLDRRTASGAEFLAASLREGLPGKVMVFGGPSYGKAHSTARAGTEGGGMLTLTEAELATASGFTWDKAGVEPDHRAK
ncbi:S41 family peptidase [Luteolibacter arcticus]|uniref:S41 family peptidase n=1 Tax=Luteolibacter arcticus TaxID=1581411 RepID=A0ABT3GFW8_9BACT|nr:S41 family peptidase [Luteolibacter arcticus]MCW1922517.1 S41 family peptidase [Luteolibacter arcticus]